MQTGSSACGTCLFKLPEACRWIAVVLAVIIAVGPRLARETVSEQTLAG